jgi:protein-tyrosine phosphatase
MKYSLTFALLGILFVYWAPSLGVLAPLLFWFAFSLFALSAGYARFGPKVFGKKPNGTIPLWSKFIHFPFMLYANLVWHVTRVFSRENPYDRFSPELILGRRIGVSEMPSGITNYVDLTAEFEDPRAIRESAHYTTLPILDGSVPSSQSLSSTISHLLDGTTFVHCAQGHGRTGLFALAVLAERGVIRTFEEGYELITQVRPKIRMNKVQKKFIKEYIQNVVQQ